MTTRENQTEHDDDDDDDEEEDPLINIYNTENNSFTCKWLQSIYF